jgi:hypothetical protein
MYTYVYILYIRIHVYYTLHTPHTPVAEYTCIHAHTQIYIYIYTHLIDWQHVSAYKDPPTPKTPKKKLIKKKPPRLLARHVRV